MKKFSTSEDLNDLLVSIPLNKARSILTMCFSTAEKAVVALDRARRGEVNVGEQQRASLEQYVDDYKLLRDLITKAIVDNVSIEDQEAIREHENQRTDNLKEEIVTTMTKRLEDLCDDPNCEACDDLRKVVSESVDPPSTEKTKTEFDLDDLPEGTILSPGSDEEN
jgi:hypothetical protein